MLLFFMATEKIPGVSHVYSRISYVNDIRLRRSRTLNFFGIISINMQIRWICWKTNLPSRQLAGHLLFDVRRMRCGVAFVAISISDKKVFSLHSQN